MCAGLLCGGALVKVEIARSASNQAGRVSKKRSGEAAWNGLMTRGEGRDDGQRVSPAEPEFTAWCGARGNTGIGALGLGAAAILAPFPPASTSLASAPPSLTASAMAFISMHTWCRRYR